jgi:hypothetical protein
MVMVPVAAEAIADLAGMVHQGVHHSVLAEQGERPVDGRKTHDLALCPQPLVDLLGGGVVGLSGEGAQNRETLSGRAQPVFLEELPEFRLRSATHRP